MFLNLPIIRHHFSSIDSTSTYAKNHYKTLNLKRLHLITALEQTSGKGTKGKKWVSPKEVNLYGTFVFSIPLPPLFSIATIGQLLALSLAEGLKTFNLSPTIKWPNDLLLNNKKICGILSETVSENNTLIVFLGFGVNVNMSEEDCNAIDQPVTSLYLTTGNFFNLETVLETLCLSFQKNLINFLKDGFCSFQQKYNTYMIYKEQPVFFEDQYLGLSQEVTSEGYLRILDENLVLKTITSGSIKLSK